MDLDYKTQANVDIDKQLNKIDKLTSRLNLTLKDIPSQEIIPQKLKEKITKIVSKDQPAKLIHTLEK